MILQQQKEVEVFKEGEENDSIAMSLDLESMPMLMAMLSKNLYADEIGSPIRELASNALDSHRRAKVDKPIIVSLKQNAQFQWEFTVEDFGIGLDDNDVKDIISKYGKSLARGEEDALGLMGLGFKSPLAYVSSFYFTARKNGVERKYMMYEGEDGNTIDLLSEMPTTQGDGVKVIVPVKNHDRHDFIRKIKEQLAYFEGVYFDVPSLDNSFKILRAEHYQQSEMSDDGYMHICLDNVYYPIDFPKLGIPQIQIPIGLRFGLKDGIFPVPSRESIRYTPVAKAKIMAKIREVANSLVVSYNNTVGKEATVWEMLEYYQKNYRNVSIGNRTVDIAPLLKYATVSLLEPKMKGISLLSPRRIAEVRSYLTNEYDEKYRVRSGKMTEIKRNNTVSTHDIAQKRHEKYFIYSEKLTGIMKEYIKSLVPWNEEALIVRRARNFKLGNRHSYTLGKTDYYTILELGKYPKWKWRQVIKEWQYLQSLIFEKFVDIDKLVIPQEWLDKRKLAKSAAIRMSKSNGRGQYIRLQGEAVGKVATDLERSIYGQNCKFVPETIKFEELGKYKGITVYTDHDNNDKLDPLYGISNGTENKLRFITFSNREIKNISQIELHNLMTYEKFMEGNNKPFKRLVTAYLIYTLMEENRNTFDKKHHVKGVSEYLYKKLKILQEYKEKYFKSAHKTIYEAMLKIAEEHKLFDMHIYDMYLEVKGVLERLTFIEPVLKVAGSSYSRYGNMNDEDVKKVLCDLFKYHKYKVNLDNYKQPAPKPVIEVADTEILEGDVEEPEEEDDDDNTVDMVSELEEELEKVA